MKRHFVIACYITLLPIASLAAQSLYCPQNHAYINVGMTTSQVIKACGPPNFKQTTNNPVVQQIPVTQLIYSTLNPGAVSFYPGLNAVYTMWSLPSGSNGINLQVTIINNKISGITLNGSATNAMSVCGGKGVQVGEPVGSVYAACGPPSLINNTYINQPVPSNAKPEMWVYQFNQFDPTIRLTFVDDALQSID